MKNMKKIVVMVTLFAAIGGAANAQTSSKENNTSNDLHFGIKAGGNVSNVYDSEGKDFEAEAKVGAVLGGFLSIPFGKYVGIQPEVLFSQKGFKGTGSILGNPYEFKRTTNFLDVPILLAIKPSSSFTLLVGPQYSFLLSEKREFNSSAFSTLQENEFNNDNIRKNILGLTGGFDVNLDKVVIGARAGWDLQNNKGDGTSSTPRYRNAWYQATIGYRF